MPENSLPAGGSGSGDQTRARRGGPHESGRWLLRPLLPPGLRRRCRGQGNSLAGGPGGGGAITSSAWGEPGREAPTRPHTHGWTLWASHAPGFPAEVLAATHEGFVLGRVHPVALGARAFIEATPVLGGMAPNGRKWGWETVAKKGLQDTFSQKVLRMASMRGANTRGGGSVGRHRPPAFPSRGWLRGLRGRGWRLQEAGELPAGPRAVSRGPVG